MEICEEIITQLENIDACLTTGEDGKEEIKAAVVAMTEVGNKINEVKKKYEDTVKIQDTFRFLGGKPANATIRLTTERHLFLFQRLLLMTKKNEEHFVCKQHINISDLQVRTRDHPKVSIMFPDQADINYKGFHLPSTYTSTEG